MGKRLNIGAGGQILSEYENLDVYTGLGATYFDFDVKQLQDYASDSVERIVCHGCLGEFKTDLVTIMNEFWRVLEPYGEVSIVVAVVDNGIGAFRDPMARRYLSSQWVQYFVIGGMWENSGYGFGFKGKFDLVSNEVSGETHHVVLRAMKHG